MVDMVRRVNLNEWVDHMQKLFCVPRGFAKTTVIKVGTIVYAIFEIEIHALCIFDDDHGT